MIGAIGYVWSVTSRNWGCFSNRNCHLEWLKGWVVVGKRLKFNNPLATLLHWGSQVNVLKSACISSWGKEPGYCVR